MRATVTFLIFGALLLAGCESISGNMRSRFNAVPPHVQLFNGDQAALCVAAGQAFRRLDFLVTRAKSVDIEAVSRIHTSVTFANSRQLAAKLHLSEAGPGKTEVAISLTEEVQSQSAGGTSQQSMRDSSFFQLYFAMLQQVLDENASGNTIEGN